MIFANLKHQQRLPVCYPLMVPLQLTRFHPDGQLQGTAVLVLLLFSVVDAWGSLVGSYASYELPCKQQSIGAFACLIYLHTDDVSATIKTCEINPSISGVPHLMECHTGSCKAAVGDLSYHWALPTN